ncbi:TlpA family protein disulfide reductase [Anaplasma centrale]|nr:thioredoxin-like domain-containing protein [Anaplasma centrale]
MVPRVLYNKCFIAVFCVLAVASFILIGSMNNYELELERSSIKIQEINSDEALYGLVSKIGAGPTLLVLYTSWCSNCVEKMPEVISIIGAYKDVEPVVISLDTNREKLAGFLLSQKQVNFVPYNVSPAYHSKLAYALAGKGVYFDGRIPYIAVLSEGSPPAGNITSSRALRAVMDSITSAKTQQ